MSTFSPEAWHYAAQVVQSEGYEAWLAWNLREIDRTWVNGLAVHVSNSKPPVPSWDDAAEQEIREIAKKLDAGTLT